MKDILFQAARDCESWVIAQMAFALHPDFTFSKEEWLAERERLLNKPSWADAPEGAVCMAMYADGWWAFFLESPPRDNEQWITARWRIAQKAIAIPAGYDWRDSLESRPV